MLKLVLHTIVIYFFLILAMRLMGKRQLGELQLSELITTFLLSEIASTPITNKEFPLHYAIISILIIIFFEIILPLLMSRFTFLKRLIESKPSYIIFKGKISQKEMKKNRITIEELLASLRTNNVADISEIQYLILEPNGKLSFFPKAESRGVTIKDLKLSVKDTGVAHPLVIDKVICEKNLQKLDMSREVFDKILERYNVTPKDVFLMTIDDAGNINLIEAEDKNSDK